MDINLFLRGGGTRLGANLGALKSIWEQGGNVVNWAAASSGGVVASYFACGYSNEKVKDILMETDFKQFLDFRPTSFLRKYGIYSGDKLEAWVNEITRERRFGDLDIPLSILALDIETGEPFVFSRERTPKALLGTAVRCSIGIPGVFTVREYEGHKLIDGVLAAVEEDELFDNERRPTVTIRLARDLDSAKIPIRKFSLQMYVQQLAILLLDAVDRARIPEDKWKRTLVLRLGNYSPINFNMSDAEKRDLYDMGYEQCRSYLDLALIACGIDEGG